jgi:hypothetical protein
MRYKIGDTVSVTTNLGVIMPAILVVTGTRRVGGEEWYELKDPKTGRFYSHFAPSELVWATEPPKFALIGN